MDLPDTRESQPVERRGDRVARLGQGANSRERYDVIDRDVRLPK
jgi:hypothetical protein